MKTLWGMAWAAACGVLCTLLFSAIIRLASSPPQGQAIILRPPPTPRPVTIHVVGAVQQPGVYVLPPDSRAEQAIAAAGGLSPAADGQAINLAASLKDGQQLAVPAVAPTRPANTRTGAIVAASDDTADAPNESASDPPVTAPSPSNPININTAALADLESLPGVGPAIAQRIVTYRETHGPFARVEDIQNVSGIGPKIFAGLKELIDVGMQP